MFDEIALSDHDRSMITDSIRRGKDQELVDVDWGELYLTHSDSTTTVGLTAPDVGDLPFVSIAADYTPVLDVLRDRGYHCTIDQQSSFECTKDAASIDGAITDGSLDSMSIWWSGPAPTYDAAEMVDADAALAAVGPRAQSLRQALVKINKEHAERVYVDGVRLLRWTTRIEITGVMFP